MMTLAASTYPAWIAVISLRVSSEYRPIGELYCFLWAGLTATLPSAGLEGALQVDEQPFACTNWGFTGREQSMVGNAINNRADKIICWSVMSPFKEDDLSFFCWLKICRSFWNILGLTFFKIPIFGDVLKKVFFNFFSPTMSTLELLYTHGHFFKWFARVGVAIYKNDKSHVSNQVLSSQPW